MGKPQIFVHVEKPLDFTAFDTKWIPCSCRFVVIGTKAKGSGALNVYEMDGNDVKLQRKMEKPNSFKCATFGASSWQNRHLATGNFVGKLEIWDLENPLQPIYAVNAHKNIVNCIDGIGGLDCGLGAAELLTGGRDGVVSVWDPRQKDEPVISIEPSGDNETRDCWTVAFGNSFDNDSRCVCAGYDNGDIKMVDLRAVKVQWETNANSGVCSIEFDRKDIKMNKLVATTLDSKFFVYDLRTQHSSKGFANLSQTVQKGTIWTVKHLPQDRDVFMTTGANGSLSLWKYSYPSERHKDTNSETFGVIGSVEQLKEASVASQPVSTFDWNTDRRGLAVCSSFDQSVRVVVVTKLHAI